MRRTVAVALYLVGAIGVALVVLVAYETGRDSRPGDLVGIIYLPLFTLLLPLALSAFLLALCVSPPPWTRSFHGDPVTVAGLAGAGIGVLAIGAWLRSQLRALLVYAVPLLLLAVLLLGMAVALARRRRGG